MKRLFFVLTALPLAAACGDDDPIVATDSGADAPVSDVGTDVIDDTATDTEADTAGDVFEDSTDAPEDTVTGPTIELVYENIFADACGGGFCHLGTQQAGGVNLELSDTLEADLQAESSVSGLNLVEAGDPSLSYLYLKTTGEFSAVGGSGGPMPLGAPPLTDDQLQLLSDWITEL